MRTTIKDIAKYTGFSITTISLVLNGKAHKIPKATEEAILQAAKELNYRPNQLAVGLVKKQTKTLGLILSDIRNSFFANMAKSIEDECRRNGWNLILCNTNDLHEREMKYLQMLADKGVDGVLICMARENDSEKVEEMVALMGVNVALLTIYDMCKAMDRAMEIFDVHLEKKDGGKSGLFERIKEREQC